MELPRFKNSKTQHQWNPAQRFIMLARINADSHLQSSCGGQKNNLWKNPYLNESFDFMRQLTSVWFSDLTVWPLTLWRNNTRKASKSLKAVLNYYIMLTLRSMCREKWQMLPWSQTVTKGNRNHEVHSNRQERYTSLIHPCQLLCW